MRYSIRSSGLAYRYCHSATIINGRVKAGQSVLITGIGGGVALVALQLCIAQGAHVYVTSGDQAKIDKAIASGAKGGVSYKNSMSILNCGDFSRLKFNQ